METTRSECRSRPSRMFSGVLVEEKKWFGVGRTWSSSLHEITTTTRKPHRSDPRQFAASALRSSRLAQASCELLLLRLFCSDAASDTIAISLTLSAFDANVKFCLSFVVLLFGRLACQSWHLFRISNMLEIETSYCSKIAKLFDWWDYIFGIHTLVYLPKYIDFVSNYE